MKTRISAIFQDTESRVLRLLLNAVSMLALLYSPSTFAKWATAEQAPLHIRRHDVMVSVSPIGMGATWKLKGLIELKINTEQGRALLARYKFPLGDDLEDLKIVSAEFFEGQLLKALPATQILLEDQEEKPLVVLKPFDTPKHYTIKFGDLPLGSVARINYEITTKAQRIPGLYSAAFTWGQNYPEFAGTMTFESKEPLYFDVSRAARQYLEFTKGRSPEGNLIYKIDLKAGVYRKIDGEQGGALSTSLVPRVQVSNQNSWMGVVDVLYPKFQPPPNEVLPAEFQRIADAAKQLPTTDDRINYVLENLNQVVTYSRRWSAADGGLAPQKLSDLARVKRGDCKDIAFATSVILRSIGHTADVALVWKQPPHERLWIDEAPMTPSMAGFNHAIIRLTDQGKTRYFDPTNPIAFAEGFLSDVAGSWALTLTRNSNVFERLPSETPMASTVRITQTLDVKPDASVSTSGRVVVEGPLAAELKQVYFSQGSGVVEPYLRSLFGIGLKVQSSQPMIQVNAKDRRGRTFEVNFSYGGSGMSVLRGPYRDVNLDIPGLAGIPALATPGRVTDVMLSKQLSFEIETRIRGGDISEEANTSCLALSSFASLIRETRSGADGLILTESLRFKNDRIPARSIETPAFRDELEAFTRCLTKSQVILGPRPPYENAELGLSPAEIASLKRPIHSFNLQDAKNLESIKSPQLDSLINMKIWLAMREMIRRGTQTPQIMLEYANVLVQSGKLAHDRFLPVHIAEAAKIFTPLGKDLAKSAKFHRVHAQLLVAAGRPKDALVAIGNAMTLEPRQVGDAMIAAEIQLKLSNPAKAEEWYNKAIALPGSKVTRITAMETLAALLLKQNRPKDFNSLYVKALREAPRNAWLLNSYSVHLQSIKQWDLAIQSSNRALALMRAPEFESVIAQALIGKAETIYFQSPGVPTNEESLLNQAESLAIECLKYSRGHALAYRIAGHASFIKAVAGNYTSLIATQSYFQKAIELGIQDAWVVDRFTVANQALETGRPITQIWTAYMTQKASRQPATKNTPAPPAPAPITPEPKAQPQAQTKTAPVSAAAAVSDAAPAPAPQSPPNSSKP